MDRREHSVSTPARAPMTILVRCDCLKCGAQVEAQVGMATVGGSCPNCGSYDLDCAPFGAATGDLRP